MKNNQHPARALELGLVKAEDAFLLFALCALTGSVLVQIIGRYVLKVPTPWCEELARYLFIALSYIGSGRAFINNGHINIDLMDTLIEKHSKDPEKAQALFNRFSALLTEIFIIAFTGIYISYLQTMAKRPQESASMHINMLIPMSFVLVGLILMTIHNGCRLFWPYVAPEAGKEEN